MLWAFKIRITVADKFNLCGRPHKDFRLGVFFFFLFNFVALGGSFAAALAYEVWLLNVGSRTRLTAAFDAHPCWDSFAPRF
jgi:hypothetical protein